MLNVVVDVAFFPRENLVKDLVAVVMGGYLEAAGGSETAGT